MPNIACSILGTNQPIRLTDVGNGDLALTTRPYIVGQTLNNADKRLSLFGTNYPICAYPLGDGSFALATATPVSAGANGDASISYGTNYPIRLVALGNGSFALGTVYQPVNTALATGDVVASILGINPPIRLIKQTKGDYAIAVSAAAATRPSADIVASLWGVNPPSRLVGMNDGTFVLAAGDYSAKVIGLNLPSLIGFWPLNETSGLTAFDKSGHGYNGTWTAGPTFNQPGIGDGNLCPLLLPATSTRVNLFTAALASAFNGKEGTVSIWFQVRAASVLSDTTARYTWIFAQDGNNQIQFRRTTTNNQYTFLYAAGGTIKSFNITNSVVGWQNATMTWSKSNDAMRGYLNGSLAGATQTGLGTYAGSLVNGNANIGAGGAIWDGYLAMMALWNVPLAASQIPSLAVVP